MATLYLFPDTNVLLHCKPLEQVDWSELGQWDQIEVLLTRPVQTEIDGLKGNGNARRAQRARAASSQIRDLLQSHGMALQLKAGNPAVRLCLRHDLRRDDSVKDLLDFGERDDQLVGIALAFHKSTTDEVWLLTNDTGPMASASAVRLPYREVPGSWLLPPELDEAERREASLRAELARLKNLEPSFAIKLDPVRLSEEPLKAYRDLTGVEIEELMTALLDRHPLCSDFGPMESMERTPARSGATVVFPAAKEKYHPATKEEITEYRKEYDEWKSECEKRLTDFAKALNYLTEWPTLSVSIENVGTRPADDALVVVYVQGEPLVQVPEKNEEGKETLRSKLQQRIELPQPPAAPRGRWIFMDQFGLGRLIADMPRLAEAWPLVDPPMPFRNVDAFKTDPNKLYRKSGKPGRPSRRIEYECAQWRHAQPAERLELNVLCPIAPNSHQGLLRVEVHAANLTQPAIAQMPLKMVLQEVSCYEIAKKALANLVDA